MILTRRDSTIARDRTIEREKLSPSEMATNWIISVAEKKIYVFLSYSYTERLWLIAVDLK